MGNVGPGGGGGEMGDHILPPVYPFPKSSSNRMARGPTRSCKTHPGEKKVGAAGVPSQAPPTGLSEKGGGE